MKTVPLSHLPVPLLFPSLICQEGDSSPPPQGSSDVALQSVTQEP